MNGYALNMAIGLQVILGALVTGLSAAVSANRVRLPLFSASGPPSPRLTHPSR